MRHLLTRFKPAASARTHLLLAALMWTVVGSVLLVVGVRWLLQADPPYVWVLLVLAVAVGWGKGHFVLARAAQRMLARIISRGDGFCLGGFLAPVSWAFVLAMILLGRLLRGGLLPRSLVGWLYVAVGSALLIGCRLLWRAWYRQGSAS